MFSFSPVHLVAWIFFICVETSPSNIDSRRLTKHQVEIDFHNREDFPDILPVILKAPEQVLKFNFSKRVINYNVPLYVPSKDAKKVVIMDTPPIKHAAFYEDQRYDASITLHCKEHGASSHIQNSCNIRLMSGFFHLDGHKHVIEPEKRDSKRVTLLASQNPNNQFVQKHRVYKLAGHNHSCDVKQNIKPFKSILKSNVITGNDRFKRSKTRYTIEVLALVTHKFPMNIKEIDLMLIYYSHVFYGVNTLYNNIDLKDVSFGVNLIGFFLEPDDTKLYQFAKGSQGDYLNGPLTLDLLAKHQSLPPADHVVMFSIHNLSDNPSAVGLANVGAMCSAGSVSLCRVLRSFEEIHIVAHEIGHSLNSYHDGINNACRGYDGYIMAAMAIMYPTKQHILNGYKFSGCSINAMKSFASSLNQNCLLSTSNLPLVAAMPTGQLYPPKEQCKTSSRSTGICPSVYTRNNSDICLSLMCRKDKVFCKSVAPAYKTTCGNKKWCIYGECVYDAKAPAADENCLFGDNENLRFTIEYPNGGVYHPKDCPDIISRVPYFCTVTSQRVHCCHTCNKLEKPGTKTTTSFSSSSSLLTSLFLPWSAMITMSSTTMSTTTLSTTTLSTTTMSTTTMSTTTLSTTPMSTTPMSTTTMSTTPMSTTTLSTTPMLTTTLSTTPMSTTPMSTTPMSTTTMSTTTLSTTPMLTTTLSTTPMSTTTMSTTPMSTITLSTTPMSTTTLSTTPMSTTTMSTTVAAANVKSELLPVALAVLHLFQLESYFAS